MWKNAIPVRCRSCRARTSIRVSRLVHAATCNRPQAFTTGELSRCCGEPLVVDTYRLKGGEHRKAACECGGYHFRHRRGSLWCHNGGAGWLSTPDTPTSDASTYHLNSA